MSAHTTTDKSVWYIQFLQRLATLHKKSPQHHLEWIREQSLHRLAPPIVTTPVSPPRRGASGRPPSNVGYGWSSRGPHSGPPLSPHGTRCPGGGRRSGGYWRATLRARRAARLR